MRLSLSLALLLATLPASAAAPAANAIAKGVRDGSPAGSTAAPAIRARWLMGTICEITAYGDGASAAATRAFEEIARLEALMSTYIKDSELSRLNRSAGAPPVPVSADLWAVLELSAGLARETGGAFDPTFSSPPAARGMRKVVLDPAGRKVGLAVGARLDLGAIGKGFALDAAAGVLKRAGVRSAMINFGGHILALGAPPGEEAWTVSVADPLCRDCPGAQSLAVKDRSVSTTGLSERPGHVIDPRTGAPALGRGGITVVAESAAEADAWSTALFVEDPGAHRVVYLDGPTHITIGRL